MYRSAPSRPPTAKRDRSPDASAYVSSSPSGSLAVTWPRSTGRRVPSTFSRSSKAYADDSNAGGSFATSTVAVADAEAPRPSETRTPSPTRPGAAGAVQRAVAASVAPSKAPSAALHAYVRRSPSGSDAVAVSCTAPPGATRQGSQDADTLGLPFDGSSGRRLVGRRLVGRRLVGRRLDRLPHIDGHGGSHPFRVARSNPHRVGVAGAYSGDLEAGGGGRVLRPRGAALPPVLDVVAGHRRAGRSAARHACGVERNHDTAVAPVQEAGGGIPVHGDGPRFAVEAPRERTHRCRWTRILHRDRQLQGRAVAARPLALSHEAVQAVPAADADLVEVCRRRCRSGSRSRARP